jgi:hypothetical protein
VKRQVLALLLLGLIGCRTDHPPKISIICLGDGFGGADCTLADGSHVSRLPSELKDFWMTTNTDMANFSSWCYGGPAPAAKAMLRSMKAEIRN